MPANSEIIRQLYSNFQEARIEHRGKAAIRAFFASLGATLTITEFTPQNYVQEGSGSG